MVWSESYDRTLWRRRADGRREQLCTFPEGHVPDGLKRDVAGSYWVTGERSGAIAVVRADGELAGFVSAGTRPLNCVFHGTTLYVTDSGPTGELLPTWDGELIRFDAGVAGMPLFRGSAEHGFAPAAGRG